MADKRDQMYMQRCFDLAKSGRSRVAPNPMVGAVIVFEDRIIGEGYHQRYGAAHAEVNAVNSVAAADKTKLESARMYVSLEPCCIHGKTPPCTDLIIKNKIRDVRISVLDQTPEVRGKGVAALKSAGIAVRTGILKKKGVRLSAFRNVFTKHGRPYIILKYAQSRDGFMGKSGRQVWLTNAFSKRLVHKWRSMVSAVLVGTATVMTDDPALTTRYQFGSSPLRVCLDKSGKISPTARIFSPESNTLVVHENLDYFPHGNPPGVEDIAMKFDDELLSNLMKSLAERRVTSLIVEGGAFTINAFLENGLWDEARVFTAPVYLTAGVSAPRIGVAPTERHSLSGDRLEIFYNPAAV